MKLKGKVVLVTGAARRVGRAIALALAKRGAHVAIHHHSSTSAAREVVRLAQAEGVDAVAVRADQSRAAQVRRAVARARDHFGKIDVLVNSAAVYHRTPFGHLSETDWDLHLDTNLKGPFLFALEVGRHLKQRRARGKIINIADWAGYRPYTDYLPYCVSKAGVICLTQALAKELAPRVQVNAVAPGPVLLPPDTSPRLKRNITRSTVRPQTPGHAARRGPGGLVPVGRR